MKMQNKKTVVTGANRSIGRAIAIELAKEGADVAISYRSDKAGAEKTKSLIEALGRRCQAFYTDFSNDDEVDSFFNEAVEFLGGIDTLVNNAAGFNTKSFLELPKEEFENVLKIGVAVPMHLGQLAANHMVSRKCRGNIINISSITGIRAYPNRSAHSTAKAGLNALTRNMAIDLGPFGIRVNAIAPGSIPHDDDNESKAWGSPKEFSLQRFGLPEDIAKAAIFLASEDSSWITGQILIVDGGQSLSFK